MPLLKRLISNFLRYLNFISFWESYINSVIYIYWYIVLYSWPKSQSNSMISYSGSKCFVFKISKQRVDAFLIYNFSIIYLEISSENSLFWKYTRYFHLSIRNIPFYIIWFTINILINLLYFLGLIRVFI